jgi:hypothetical protein
MRTGLTNADPTAITPNPAMSTASRIFAQPTECLRRYSDVDRGRWLLNEGRAEQFLDTQFRASPGAPTWRTPLLADW